MTKPALANDVAPGSGEGSAPPPPDEELVVMRLVAEGLTDAVIARQLGVSEITVRRRVRRFRDRVGATTRLQAAVIATRRGWV